MRTLRAVTLEVDVKPGPKKKPTELKTLAGNPGGHSLPTDTMAPGKSDAIAPEHLRGPAREMWEKLSKALKDVGLMTVADEAALCVACMHYGLACKYYETLVNLEDVAVTNEKGQTREHPAVKLYKTTTEAFRKLCAEFGLTPSGRAERAYQKMEHDQGEIGDKKPGGNDADLFD